MYGWNEPEHRCWYRDRGDFEHIIWEMATIYVWIGSSLYCLCIVIVVILKLKSPKNNFESAIDSTSVTSVLEAQSQITPKTSPSNSLTSNIIKRVTWYPIIPIITQTPSFLFEVFKHSSQHISFSLYLACYVCAALQGFLHAVVFSQDIAVSRGCSALRMYLWRKYVHEYELRYPQYSLGCNNLKRGKKSSNAQNFENSVTNNFENPNLQNEDSKIHRLKYNSCAITSIWEPTTKESLQYKFFSRFLKHPTEKPLYKQKYTATPSIIKSRNDNQRKKAEQKSTIDQNIELIDIPTKNSMKNLEKNTEISKKSSFEAIAIPQNYSIINPDENPFLLSLQFPKHHRTQSSNYKTTNGNRLLYMTNNFNSLSSVDEVSLETTSNMSVDSSSKLLDTYFKKL
ncbi:hypothetical protein G9A89_005684 [Geosiphon pyriformis]|nr:hypothetical protein G9A89_005684 [Geosiphon pyriformis]